MNLATFPWHPFTRFSITKLLKRVKIFACFRYLGLQSGIEKTKLLKTDLEKTSFVQRSKGIFAIQVYGASI